jgi:hypothetical protein
MFIASSITDKNRYFQKYLGKLITRNEYRELLEAYKKGMTYIQYQENKKK